MQAVDFTHPFKIEKGVVIVRITEASEYIERVFLPLNIWVWIAILGCLLTASMSLLGIARYKHDQFGNLGCCVFYCLLAFLGQGTPLIFNH